MKLEPRIPHLTHQNDLLLAPKLGFSLVEMIIVVTLTVMIIVAATSVLLTTLLGGGKVNTTRDVKQNGDYAMAQMTTLLRNSVKLLPNDAGQTCTLGMSQLRVKSFDEGVTTFGKDTQSLRIASNSAYLTSDSVSLPSDLNFDCTQSSDGRVTTVTISFTLAKGDAATNRQTELASETFSQSVTIRSY